MRELENQKGGFFYMHTPNGGKRVLREANMLKRMGVKAGVRDFIIFFPTCTAFVEMKAQGEGLSKPQKEVTDKLVKLGYIRQYLIATDDPNDAIAQLKNIFRECRYDF